MFKNPGTSTSSEFLKGSQAIKQCQTVRLIHMGPFQKLVLKSLDLQINILTNSVYVYNANNNLAIGLIRTTRLVGSVSLPGMWLVRFHLPFVVVQVFLTKFAMIIGLPNCRETRDVKRRNRTAMQFEYYVFVRMVMVLNFI